MFQKLMGVWSDLPPKRFRKKYRPSLRWKENPKGKRGVLVRGALEKMKGKGGSAKSFEIGRN